MGVFLVLGMFSLRPGSIVHCIYGFSLPETPVKILAKNLARNLAKNLVKNLTKNLVNNLVNLNNI